MKLSLEDWRPVDVKTLYFSRSIAEFARSFRYIRVSLVIEDDVDEDWLHLKAESVILTHVLEYGGGADRCSMMCSFASLHRPVDCFDTTCVQKRVKSLALHLQYLMD